MSRCTASTGATTSSARRWHAWWPPRSADRDSSLAGPPRLVPVEQRTLGRTGRTISVIGLGTWQLGADWGDVSEDDARAVLDASHRAGVTFFDTADVYGDGRSESLIGSWRSSLSDGDRDPIPVPPKIGRRATLVPENYPAANFRDWVDRSRANLRMDTLDLVQLHCPPTPVYGSGATYDAL